jgi:hypothetical protein
VEMSGHIATVATITWLLSLIEMAEYLFSYLSPDYEEEDEYLYAQDPGPCLDELVFLQALGDED